jgi:hypothetical protein
VLLYVLVFRDEPLIKIGIARDVAARVAALGNDRFNLAESYCVTASDNNCIRLLEKNRHAIFAEHRAIARSPLTSGNTEIFHASTWRVQAVNPGQFP